MARDTTPEAAALQLEIHRRLGGAGRLQLALEMSEMARGLAAARVRAEHPDWSDREIKLELVRIALLTSPRR